MIYRSWGDTENKKLFVIARSHHALRHKISYATKQSPRPKFNFILIFSSTFCLDAKGGAKKSSTSNALQSSILLVFLIDVLWERDVALALSGSDRRFIRGFPGASV